MTIFRLPAGVTSVSFDGREYEAPDGVAELPLASPEQERVLASILRATILPDWPQSLALAPLTSENPPVDPALLPPLKRPQLMAALKAMGIAFAVTAKMAELQALWMDGQAARAAEGPPAPATETPPPPPPPAPTTEAPPTAD